jgi:hypothetical protein
MSFFLLLLATVAQSGPYEVTLRLPAGGLFAQEEMQIEYRVVDTSRVDPLFGPAAVIRAQTASRITMPSMAGMPALTETAHPEGIPGEYGIHPFFPHGGEYLLTLQITPPAAEAFTVTFPLTVADPNPARRRPPPPFTLELKASPSSPSAARPVKLRFTVRRRDTRQIVKEFELQHERLFHLILVDRELSRFYHEHPTLQSDGSFLLTHSFLDPGEYHLFADVAPAGAGGQVLLTKLQVGGRTPHLMAPPPPSTLATFPADPVTAGRTLRLTATLKDPNIEPYLGARGHLILIHEDAETFVHCHPDESVPSPADQVPFVARFPKPGRYQGWAQFQRNGRVETVRTQFLAQ